MYDLEVYVCMIRMIKFLYDLEVYVWFGWNWYECALVQKKLHLLTNTCLLGLHLWPYIIHTSCIIQHWSWIIDHRSYVIHFTPYTIHHASCIMHRTSYNIHRTSNTVHQTSFIFSLISEDFRIRIFQLCSHLLLSPKLPRTEGERAKPETQNYLFSHNLRGKLPRRLGENK